MQKMMKRFGKGRGKLPMMKGMPIGKMMDMMK
jgi:hypothetical protein